MDSYTGTLVVMDIFMINAQIINEKNLALTGVMMIQNGDVINKT